MFSLAGVGAVVSQQSAKGSDTSSTAPTDCLMCASTVQRKAYAFSCATCPEAVHMSCLNDQYMQTDVTLAQSRNSLEWLKGLLLFTDLQYMCQLCRSGNPLKSACIENSDIQTSTPPAAIEELKAHVIRISHVVTRIGENVCNMF